MKRDFLFKFVSVEYLVFWMKERAKLFLTISLSIEAYRFILLSCFLPLSFPHTHFMLELLKTNAKSVILNNI